MKFKVFTANTIQEAMTQVKSELGMDAVILHTRRFNKGGIFGYLGKEMVEVMAAIDDKQQEKVKLPKEEFKELLTEKAKIVETTPPPVVAPPIPVPIQEKTNPNNENPEKINFIPQQVSAKAYRENKESKEQDKKIKELELELTNMKKMLEQVINEVPQNNIDKVSLFQALIDNEVDDKTAQKILEDIVEPAVLEDINHPKAIELVAKGISKTLPEAKGISYKKGESKIVALIGATGVGKTTTIAKLAATFVLKKNCKVALITADTYRISAVEQLKTYADIIGIPIEIVYSPEDLSSALIKHSDKELILVDTAGRSQHNQFQIAELQSLLEVNPNIEKHLVLSSTTKYKDAADIIRKFSICSPNKILFTKTDETGSLGTIVNLANQFSLTLSYLTTGQSVPDDIILAEPKELAKLILRK